MDDEILHSDGTEKTISRNDAHVTISRNDADALKRCVEENKDDRSKCKAMFEAFKDSAYSSSPSKRPSMPFMPDSGSLTDV